VNQLESGWPQMDLRAPSVNDTRVLWRK